MRPFFFGETAEPLLGLYHPPSGLPRSVGVAILNPFGDEYIRAHRPLRELADRLARAGFHVLRFDYFGCGDSAGEDHEGRLERWVDDAAAAAEELEAIAGSPRVALVGLRLGASLAVRLTTRRPGVDYLVLWDAVGDGRLYLEELDAADEAFRRENARRATEREAARPPERLGFPLPEPLRAEIEAVDLFRHAAAPAPHVLVLATGGEGPALFPGGAPPGGTLERECVPGMPVWSRGEEATDGTVVPVEALERITAWLTARCP